jgi:hypothetical protein
MDSPLNDLPPLHPEAPLHADVAADELPVYAERPAAPQAPTPTGLRRERTEHEYALTNRGERPWLTLKLRSRAQQPSHVPYYFEGDELAGRVELCLENEDNIQAVAVIVRVFAHVPVCLYN